MASHGYTWAQVRRGSTADLSAGDTIVIPGIGTAYHAAVDGSVRGRGELPLDGTAWTVQGWSRGQMIVRSHEGAVESWSFPVRPRAVLIVRTS